MEIDKTIREYMKEAVDEVNEELNLTEEKIGHIMFANICIERFLEKLGRKS